MLAYLYPKHHEQEHLSPKEVASNLAQEMPTVLIDWVRGDQEVAATLQQLIAMNSPEPILSSHKSLLGNSVHIEVTFPNFPDKYIGFIVQPDCRINLESDTPGDRDFIQYAADRLASALGYAYKIVSHPNSSPQSNP